MRSSTLQQVWVSYTALYRHPTNPKASHTRYVQRNFIPGGSEADIKKDMQEMIKASKKMTLMYRGVEYPCESLTAIVSVIHITSRLEDYTQKEMDSFIKGARNETD